MKLELIKASDVEIKEVEWLWYPYIPYGKVTVLQGDSGDGKSTFVLNLAAMLSRGEPMPFTDGSGQEPVNIIYQSSEDDADDTIVPRFVKAGGDPNRLFFISEREKYLSFSDERLLEAVRKTNAKLIVLDPLSAYIGEETRINTANEIRLGSSVRSSSLPRSSGVLFSSRRSWTGSRLSAQNTGRTAWLCRTASWAAHRTG